MTNAQISPLFPQKAGLVQVPSGNAYALRFFKAIKIKNVGEYRPQDPFKPLTVLDMRTETPICDAILAFSPYIARLDSPKGKQDLFGEKAKLSLVVDGAELLHQAKARDFYVENITKMPFEYDRVFAKGIFPAVLMDEAGTAALAGEICGLFLPNATDVKITVTGWSEKSAKIEAGLIAAQYTTKAP